MVLGCVDIGRLVVLTALVNLTNTLAWNVYCTNIRWFTSSRYFAALLVHTAICTVLYPTGYHAPRYPRYTLLLTQVMYVQSWVTFLYSTANLGPFSPVLSIAPSLHLSSPLHCGNHCTKTLMDVSCEFYDLYACLFICAFVSYVEPHFSSFCLLCRSHDNTALTPQLHVVHFFACFHFALLGVSSHCLCVFVVCIYYDTS